MTERRGYRRAVINNVGGMRIITKDMYTNPDVAVREMISNAIDAYGKTPNKEIFITIDSLRGTFKLVDNATGITVTLEEFEEFSIGRYDGVVGKIGHFHVGKASFLKMSKRKEGEIVTFRSNNGQEGIVTHLSRFDDDSGEIFWDDRPFRYPAEQAHLARPGEKFLGMTVEVADIIDELRNINVLKRLIAKWFGILIARGVKIYIRDLAVNADKCELVQKPNGLDTNETHRTPELLLNDGTYISHCLKHDLKPKYENIDVYVEHVYIRSIHLDYCVTGWINCNSFQLNTARDGLQTGKDTPYYEGVYNKFEPWLPTAGYERQHHEDNKPMSKNDTKRFEDTITKVITKMSARHKDLIPKLLGISNVGGIPGTPTQTQTQGSNDNKQYDELGNQKYNMNGDPNGSKVLFGGHGTSGTGTKIGVRVPGPGGKGETRGVEPGGTHTVLVQKKSTGDTETNVIPPIKIGYTEQGDLPTITIDIFPNEGIYAIVNTDKAAAKILKENQQLLDKTVVEAVYRTAYPGNSVAEYSEWVDQLWNDMC